jgi:lysozyme
MKKTIRYNLLAATISTFGCLGACAQQGPLTDQTPTDLSQLTSAQALTACPGNSLVAGIDISYPQVDFDLARAKANGDRFVYIGATYGITIQQPTYAPDKKKAEDLGMIHGPYHFFVPTDDPDLQADNFLKVIGNSDPKGDLPPALDWEDNSGTSWGEAFTRAQIFLDRVEKATGRTPVIYTYSDFFSEAPPKSFAKYPLWISNTGDGDGPTCPPIPAPWDHWLFYQFNTSGGLDKDRFNGTLADLKNFANDATTSPSAPTSPTPVTQTCDNVAAGEEPVLTACNADAINAVAPASAKTFLARAYNWIDRGVQYCECVTGEGGDYRTDCSGFVSYVWGLPAPGNTTYSFAGGPWNNDDSVRISWSQLTPGDAINFPGDPAAGTGHVMLWGGWLNKEHTEICTMEEYYPGHPASFMTHSVYEDWPAEIQTNFLPIRKAGYVPSTTTCTTLAGPLDQVENNSSLSAITWSDGHIELFSRTSSDRAAHVWTDGDSDNWHGSEDFSGQAECGLASVMSYAGEQHAELFDPDSAGQTQSLYFLDGWHDFTGFDGRGMTQLTTLRWSDKKSGGWDDGRTEVFALADDHRIYHKYFDPASNSWKGWDSLGGQLATGVSAILDQSGDGVLFSTDRDGQAWYNRSKASTGEGWTGWKAMGGHLSSRPVVVREGGGTLEIFARGMDGELYGAHSTEAGFSPFEAINGQYQIAGEPAAAIDDGKVEVFVRGTKGKIGLTTMNPTTHKFSTPFAERAPGTFSSEPFAWQRPDGRVELFAVTTEGHLTATYHSATGWTAWKRLATGIDACPAPAVGCPNGNGTYCGGHGVGGTPGSLYTCNEGMLTLDERCSASCQETGNGGADVCAQQTGCEKNSDCVAAYGQYAVCVTPSLFCADPETNQPNYCTTQIQATEDQPCTQTSDCDPAGTGDMTCGTCIGSCGAAKCCENTGV